VIRSAGSIYEANLSSATVLVTGGAGFIGSRVVDRLLEAGAKVTVLDDFFTGKKSGLPHSQDLAVVEGSVTDFDLVSDTMEGADIVIHQAARNIVVSTVDPRKDFKVNVGGTLNVLLAARELGLTRVVYASSASVYGNPRYLPINEDDLPNTLSPYSVSKYSGENYCRAFYETYGLSTVSIRYSNVFGPGQTPENPYAGVVAKFFEWASSGEQIRVHGDGEQTRDFTFVDDVVEATLLAAIAPKAEGQVYNVGTGRETSVNNLAALILTVTGSNAGVVHVDKRDIDNIRRRVVNIEKIRRELRWVPSTTIEEGLRLTHDWLAGDAHARTASES
jgi:UDP-glucose 4-epimerase